VSRRVEKIKRTFSMPPIADKPDNLRVRRSSKLLEELLLKLSPGPLARSFKRVVNERSTAVGKSPQPRMGSFGNRDDVVRDTKDLLLRQQSSECAIVMDDGNASKSRRKAPRLQSCEVIRMHDAARTERSQKT
jgi:hypothetical protein